MLADSARTLLKRCHDSARLRRLRDGAIPFDPGFWTTAAEAGWLGLRLPERLGGLGLDVEAGATVAGVLGRHGAPDPFIGAAFFPAVVLSGLADPAPVLDLAQGLMAGEAAVAVVDAAEAVFSGNHATLAAPPSGPVMVFCRGADGEGRIVLVDADVAPLARRDGSFGGSVGLTEASLQAGTLLASGAQAAGLWGLARFETTLVASAYLNGVSRTALDLAIAHVQQREQFGRKLADFQVLQHMLVDLRSQLRLSEASVAAALRLADASETVAARLALHAAKARASDCAMAITRGAIQLHGALGFTDEADIGLYAKIAMNVAQTMGTAAFHRDAYLHLSRESGHVA